ncbi:MAG TPA: class I SAM-dependent methyltransferase [Pirellulales bacterium]|nr:class I SAM-dependent methyltransferase [Pirellulales bacterium]
MAARTDDSIGAGPTQQELKAIFTAKHGDLDKTGWMPRLWHAIGYFSPDDYYEATVAKLVFPACSWLDVGCGRSVFPGNDGLAFRLASRCGYLLGADPDKTIAENTQVHERSQSTIELLRTDRKFDLITLRMVAEHIEDPESAVAALARLAKPGALVVILTVNRWSPVAVAAKVVPHGLHHSIKRWLWATEEKDTFRVSYRMNTRGRLRRLLIAGGFRERAFSYVDDCRSLYRFRWLHRCELSVRRLFRLVGLPYPENCLLGVYERLEPDRDAKSSSAPPNMAVCQHGSAAEA